MFFTNVDLNLTKDMTNPDYHISVYDYLGSSIEQSFFLKPVYEEEVTTTVKTCSKMISSDFEDISRDIVAKVIYVICKPEILWCAWSS